MKKFGVLCLLLLMPVLIHAQTADPSQITDEVDFTVTPQVPGPHENAYITIEAYGIDLSTAHITWSLNGSILKSGQGITNLSITTGDIGSHSLVTASIDTGSGAIIRSLDLVPGSVDLLWQGGTYAPPFYKGRTSWTHEGRMTLVAIPHIIQGGKDLDPSTLSYRWTQDGTVIGASSGTGKNSFTLSDSVLSLVRSITVDVMTDRDTIVGTASANLAATDPQVLVYENSPLYGLLFNRETGNGLTLTDKEVTFSAIPYFYSGSSKHVPALSYTWTTNGADPQTGDHITYRAPDSTAGNSNVAITVTNTNTILQSAQKAFLVQFGDQGTSL